MTDPRRSVENGDKAGADIGDIAPRIREIDRHIGERMRERRLMLGLSLQQLASMIGVTYQQAHKYEAGVNRVSAGRLFMIAEVLAVPVDWFFENLTRPTTMLAPMQLRCIELTRDFAAIHDEEQRRALSQLARIFATGTPAPNEPAAPGRTSGPLA